MLGDSSGQLTCAWLGRTQEVTSVHTLTAPASYLHGETTQPTSILIELIGGQLSLLAVHKDHRLRAWSLSNYECVLDMDLTQFTAKLGRQVMSGSPGHMVRLVHGHEGCKKQMVAIYMCFQQNSHFLFVSVSSNMGQFNVDLVNIVFSPDSNLVGFSTSDRILAGVWITNDGDTVVRRIVVGGVRWDTITTTDSKAVVVSEDLELKHEENYEQVYLRALFSPGAFLASTLIKTVAIFKRCTDREKWFSWDSLREEVVSAVECEVQSSLQKTEVTLKEATIVAWARFYSCVCQCRREGFHPMGLVTSKETSVVMLIGRQLITWLSPVGVMEKVALNEKLFKKVPEGAVQGCNITNEDEETDEEDPYIFNETDHTKIESFKPLKRKILEENLNPASSKKLKKIFDDILHPKVEVDMPMFDKKFSVQQNLKLSSIFSDLVSKRVDGESGQISKTVKSGICIIQCCKCCYSATSLEKFYDSTFHPCVCLYDAMVCETCQKMANDVESLSLHVRMHGCNVLFLKPIGRRPEYVTCSSDCLSKQCDKKPKNKVASIRTELEGMGSTQLHRFLLSRLDVQKSLGLDSCHSLVLQSEVFCHNSCFSLLNISKYLVKKVFQEHIDGKKNFTHGNLGNMYSSTKRDKAVCFILQFARMHCENLPDRQVMRLPSYLNIKEIFHNYCESVPEVLQLKERSFFQVFKTSFGDVARPSVGLPRVVFMPRTSHPVCSECDQINTLQKFAKSESETMYANQRKKSHVLNIREKYLQFCERRELAVRFPDDYLSLGMDDIDQSKIKTPYTAKKTKDCAGMLKLDNHCTGVIVTSGKFKGDRCVFAYLNNNQFPQDSNKTASIVFDVLMFVKTKFGKLPRKMLVQSDNCSRDLKNQLVLAFYWVLVEYGVFEEVVVSHMPVGHTHGDVDQVFSIFASQLRKVELPTFESLLDELKKIKIDSQPILVREMVHTTDFVKHINPLIQQMTGHTGFHQFKIRKGENNLTKLFLKQDVLEKAWQFASGVWLLKSPPTMKKLDVSQFRSESDYADIFSSVWKKYLPTLTVKFSEEEVAKIKVAWETRITFLVELNVTQFKAFDLFQLVPDVPSSEQEQLSASFLSRAENVGPSKEAALTAIFYPPEMKTFSVDDLFDNCSVVFYTLTRMTRPWIGLFIGLIEEGESSVKIKVEWLKKDKKYYVLDSTPDGAPYYSTIGLESVMFSNVLRNISPKEERSGPYILDKETKKSIDKAYNELDLKY